MNKFIITTEKTLRMSTEKENNKEKKNNKKEKNNEEEKIKRALLLYAITFILISVILYLISYIVSLPEVDYPTFKDIFRFLAGAFLTTGIFSILLGFNEFIDYVNHHLREIVVEHSYLKMLNSKTKIALKKAIDDAQFGEGVTNDETSLYSYINAGLNKLSISSYRTDFKDLYHIKEENKDFWKISSETSYTLYKNQEDQIVIGRTENERYYCPSMEPESYIVDSNVTIGTDKFTLEKINEDGKTKCVFKANSNNVHLKNDIDIIFNTTPDNVRGNTKSTKLKFSYTFILPNSMFINNEKGVHVSFLETTLSHKSENYIYTFMSRPTKNMYATCLFDNNTFTFHCSGVSFDGKEPIKYIKPNMATIDIKEWVLPGHGAIIIWNEENKEQNPKINPTP